MRPLRELERLRMQHGGEAARLKLACLRDLERAELGRSGVLRLHEALCYLRAFPDDAAILAAVTHMLARFERRPDLRRAASQLVDTGVAGTSIHYPFFADTAAWLAERHPSALELDWDAIEDEHEQHLLDRLDLLVHYSETPSLDELDLTLRQWLRRLKGPTEAEGAFLARRFAALEADPFLRESYWDELGLPLVLRPRPGTPSRTHARAPRGTWCGRVEFQRGPLRDARPDLAHALRRRPRVHELSRTEGERAIGLAREAMVTRSRDLDCFVYGDARDVRRIECEGGLEFLAIGLRPERRLLLEAVYGFLTLQNGVPIGYVLNSALFGSAEIAYNVFETFRGAQSAHVYGWVLSSVRRLFGVDSFTVYPYQLGHENEEGLASGAWWFYHKLGFRPRAPQALALMGRESARQRRDPAARSTLATLRKLAAHNVYYCMGRERRDVIGEISLASIALRASALLARRFGADRERGALVSGREAARRFGLGSTAAWTSDERRAWRRLAPVLVQLPGVERWRPAERRAAVAAIRAKGGRRESAFVLRFDAHPKLRAAVLALARDRTLS